MTEEIRSEIYAKLEDVIVETCKEIPAGVPGGTLYAFLMAFGVTFEMFQTMMGGLVTRGRLRCVHHVYFAN